MRELCQHLPLGLPVYPHLDTVSPPFSVLIVESSDFLGATFFFN